MNKSTEKPRHFSPKSFLKARRPERFSDSVNVEVGRLNRVVLEHHLSTLNKRNQELVFEEFVKQLCEKVICPNLLAQTGPVAGGDGKVDTQTFPVSEQTKVLWYLGVNNNAEKERWAFAVSTQETWKPKCRGDVLKIKDTNRDYKKIFCVTSMYAKANQRSDLEDSLSEETGIDVRILDVTWILDQIFKNGYEQLAIDVLSIETDWQRKIEVGANDYSKKYRIKELQNDIKSEINTDRVLLYQLDWLLEEAVLSKELEKPFIETQGLFERAISAALRFGSPHHKFSAHYQFAWASYWWYEDIELFVEQLKKCINVAKDINQSGQWGDVVTLLGLYSSYGRITDESDLLDIDALRLEAEKFLSVMAQQEERPSNSLMAKADIEILKLYIIEDNDQASEIFTTLLSIAKKGDFLLGFSFLGLYRFVLELDAVFGELKSFEVLLDYLTSKASSREGELREALLWLKRGAKRIDSGKPYQAIKLIGKSLVGLNKKEVRKDLYAALNILSVAYQRIGLLWASRANLLLAASIITDEHWRSGDLYFTQVSSYIRLAKGELLIGRVNYALVWWNLACLVNANISEEAVTEEDQRNFDAFLSQCILNSKLPDLVAFSNLPDLLDKYQLYASRSTLLYVLGYEDIVADEYEVDINPEYVDFLVKFRDYDLGVSPPEKLVTSEETYSHLFGTVMGCKIKISFPFRTPLVEFAETILSVIEGFLSTCIVDQVIVVESRLDIEISADDDDEICISHDIDDASTILKIDILCSSFTREKMNISSQSMIHEWLSKFVVEVFAYLTRTKNLESTMKSMLDDDKALDRSVSFNACFIGQQNILGDDAVKDIKSLFVDDELRCYKLLRSKSWDIDFPKLKLDVQPLIKSKPRSKDLPGSLMDEESLSHQNIKIQNLIKVRLWDRTVWRGVAFTMTTNGTPGLLLLFENEQFAAKIFDDLDRELGEHDNANRLRVSIIRHINKQSPADYRMVISENLSLSSSQRVHMVSRMQTMGPPNKKSMEDFLEAYGETGCYELSYGLIENKQFILPTLPDRKYIKKSHINVIDAWEIGPNDIDMVAIQEDDTPIIPEGIENPPVNKTLKQKFGLD